MTECSACGAELAAHETRCPVCRKPTVYYHRQRRCLNCGTPAAQKARTCMMCGQPVDSLPLEKSIFGGSWWGVSLGVLIIVGVVIGLVRYQANGVVALRSSQSTVPALPTPTPMPITATPTRTPTITYTPIPTATPSPTATPTPRIHTIERGENPSFIADRYGVSVEDLIAVNDIDDVSSLQVGQKLIIPANSATGPRTPGGPTPAEIIYEVKGGDTLLGIAYDHGTSVEAIQAANPDANVDLIYPGQTLIVPLATPTITPTPAPLPTDTPTPGPLYEPPALLTPADGQVAADSTLLFNWTATGLLAKDEFYVLQLAWADGSTTEQWLKNSSWRVTKEDRPASGPVTWSVSIMRQTGTNPDGSPQGLVISASGRQRTVTWP